MWLISTIGRRHCVIKLWCLQPETTLMMMISCALQRRIMGWRTSFTYCEHMITFVFHLDFLTVLGTYLEWLSQNLDSKWATLPVATRGAVLWCLTVNWQNFNRCLIHSPFLFYNNPAQLRYIHLFSTVTLNSTLLENEAFPCRHCNFSTEHLGSKWIF